MLYQLNRCPHDRLAIIAIQHGSDQDAGLGCRSLREPCKSHDQAQYGKGYTQWSCFFTRKNND